MGKIENDVLFKIYMEEYSKLKDEQRSRIGFRDNLIYVTLVCIGAILSYATRDPKNYYALLILPISDFILGLTWLLNDEKITSIREYIQNNLTYCINKLLESNDSTIFAWENFHRKDKNRMWRKIFQLLANELLYCISGLFSVFLFFHYSQTTLFVVSKVSILGIFEIILLIIIGVKIFLCSDIKDSNS